jgi:hypothetical protein
MDEMTPMLYPKRSTLPSARLNLAVLPSFRS